VLLINDKISFVKKVLGVITTLFILILVLSGVWYTLLGPAGDSADILIYKIPENQSGFDLVKELSNLKLIKNEEAFRFLLDNFAVGKEIKPGGYKLNQRMNAMQIIKKITGKQDLFWFTISYCLRKEQIGELLAETLGWNNEKLQRWNNLYKNQKSEYFEGVYYPDTYLLPSDENESQIAQRFIDRFNEKFAPLAAGFIEKNIKWTTGLKIASLIAREAAGTSDMKLISGIIWNRLNIGMPLQIDATMQYTLGKNSQGSWWGMIDLKEKQSDSPYNSYLRSGLPPTPICSPNISAIEAALNPEDTGCLYYLHDKNKDIHCANTYEEHKKNIEKYLN